jgi:tetratricopeptide (TPR) repeat protein
MIAGPNRGTTMVKHRGPRGAARRAALGLVAGMAWAATLTGCDREAGAGAKPPAPQATPGAFSDGTPRQRPEFEAIAERVLREGNPTFFPKPRIAALEQRLSDSSLPLTNQLELSAQLAEALMQDGDLEQAITTIERVFELGKALPGLDKNARLHWLRGVIYLRQSETQNCVLQHNADCCVFPLKDGGVHTQRAPAEKAREAFMKYVQLQPDDLRGRWMINLLAMALAEYPDGVPQELRIPPEAFDSDYAIGRFPDIAPKLGLDTFNSAGGAMAEDFDGDGLLDVITSSMHPRQNMTYKHNDGDGKFSDRTAESRLDDQLGGLECMATDFDNDDDMDILVLRGAWLFDDGRMRPSLLRNDGHGVFTDVTRAAGIAEPAAPTQAGVWADFDNDGDLDLFIGHESRVMLGDPKGNYPSQLFRNNGDGTFTDIAQQAGLLCNSYVKGATAGDFDNDGWMDLYVSNVGPNKLFRNNGNMTFTDVTDAAGVVEPAKRSFAPWFFDYDNDGWLDIYVGAYDATVADTAADYLGQPDKDKASRPALYHNNGDGTFANVAKEMGLDRPVLPMGANFGDLDNDGWLDLYLTTGDPNLDTLVPNLMFRNDGGRKFQDVTKAGGFGHLQKGHGVAFADLDNDGDQDLFHQIGGFFEADGFRNALYHNPGHGNHFLTLVVRGATSNRSGVGARIAVTVQTPAGPREIHRAVGSVSSFGGSPVSRQQIGLGDATAISRLSVRWPASGTTQVFENVPLDSFVRVTEGEAELERLELPKIEF